MENFKKKYFKRNIAFLILGFIISTILVCLEVKRGTHSFGLDYLTFTIGMTKVLPVFIIAITFSIFSILFTTEDSLELGWSKKDIFKDRVIFYIIFSLMAAILEGISLILFLRPINSIVFTHVGVLMLFTFGIIFFLIGVITNAYYSYKITNIIYSLIGIFAYIVFVIKYGVRLLSELMVLIIEKIGYTSSLDGFSTYLFVTIFFIIIGGIILTIINRKLLDKM